MKVIVTLEVDIVEPADWRLAFGFEDSTPISVLKQDVKEYILNEVQHAGTLGNGEIDNTVRLR